MAELPRQRNGRVHGEVLHRIARAHVESALDALDGDVAHAFGASTDYDLIARERAYPPKAVLGVAAQFAIGSQLGPDDFSGGEGSTCFAVLRELGYTIVPKASSGKALQQRCVVWNNIMEKHVALAVGMCATESLGKVAFQRGGTVLPSILEASRNHPALALFIVQGTGDRVVARGTIERVFRRAEMTPIELDDANRVRLATDAALSEEYVLLASRVVPCEPPVDIRSFVKCSDDTPLKPGGQWPASICYLPPELEPADEPDVDDELAGFTEGEARTRMVRHRRREGRLRKLKIAESLRRNGTVRCEVDGCGFDFLAAYGDVGREYGQVHHLHPLADADGTVITRLEDVAVLCANCHAMVHRGGQSRSLEAVAAMLRTARAPSA
jgi:hypothetical protein